MDNNSVKVAFVTGASSGIGKAVAQIMAKDGYTVYGTSRKANYETVNTGGTPVTMLPLALEDVETIKKAIAYITNRHGGIDVVVNAAGSGIAGAIEETTVDEAKFQFDVCFFGVISVLNHVLPVMRKAGRGKIINIGSLASCFPVPFQALYSAAKSALFSLTVALRMELEPFGITACTIEPGNTISGFIQSRKYAEKTRNTAYRLPLERALCVINSKYAACSSETCAKTVLKAVKKKNPPVRMTPGFGYKVLYGVSRLVPWRLKQSALCKIYLSKNPSEDSDWTFNKQFKER